MAQKVSPSIRLPLRFKQQASQRSTIKIRNSQIFFVHRGRNIILMLGHVRLGFMTAWGLLSRLVHLHFGVDVLVLFFSLFFILKWNVDLNFSHLDSIFCNNFWLGCKSRVGWILILHLFATLHMQIQSWLDSDIVSISNAGTKEKIPACTQKGKKKIQAPSDSETQVEACLRGASRSYYER